MAGWDSVEGPRLYHTDPSGTYIKCEAKAIGSAAEVAQSTLKEQYKPDMTFKVRTTSPPTRERERKCVCVCVC